MPVHRPCTVVALCAVLAACGASFKPPAGDGPYLRAIRIEGTQAIPVEEIAPGLSIERARGKRQVDAYQMSVDVNRVRAAYLKLGFFDVKVDARVDVKGREQTVVFVVTEGVRSKTRVEILGLPPEIPYDSARQLVGLRDGDPFDYEKFDLAKAPMLQLVENAGYAQSDIQAVVLADRAKHVATIRFAVVAGQRSTFGKIRIRGAGPLEDAVRDRLKFKPGDVYTQRDIVATQNALYELNRFSTVRIEPEITKGTVVPVTITLQRIKSGEVRLGGGIGHDTIGWEARVRMGISYIFDALPLWSFDFDFRPGVIVNELSLDAERDLRIRGIATAKRNDLLIPNLTGIVELSADYLHYEAFLTWGPRLRLGLASPLAVPWLTGRVGWVIEQLDIDDVVVTQDEARRLGLVPEPLDPDLPPPAPEAELDYNAQRRGAYEATITADLRDNPIDVHEGVYLSAAVTRGTSFALGRFDYTKVGAEARGFIPIGDFVIAARVRLGGLYGATPINERLYLGGLASHRGFRDRRLSPYAMNRIPDDAAVPVGGVTSIENGIELRIPLADEAPGIGLPLGMSVFLDGADVKREDETLDFFDQHLAVGIAVYAKLFGLKAGVDLGYRITRRDAYSGGLWSDLEANAAWHLVIGDAY